MAVKPIVLPITYKSDPRGLRDAENQLKGFAGGIGKVVAGATAAVGILGGASVKAFADFDAAMTQSLAIMGDVSDAMQDEMANAAREVAKTTTFSANQAAESFFFLASAGLDAKASIQALPTVASFAQAGMFDMALATDLLTDAQSALGLTIRDDAVANMKNMARVSDVLVKANTLANASVEQFSVALTTKAGAALKMVGKDIEEGVAVLAAFADQGIKAELGGNALSMMLRDLSTKAIDNKKAFADLGVEVFDDTGEFRNIADVIADLEVALAGMSDETQKATLLQLGFSDRSLTAVAALLGQSDAIRNYEAELRNAGGTTEEVAEKQLDTLSAQFGLLKDEVIDVGIELGKNLEPAFKGLVTDIKPVIGAIGLALVPAFKQMMPVIQELITGLPGLIQSLIPLIPTMVNIASAVFELAVNLLPVFLTILDMLLPTIQGFTDFVSRNGEAVAAVVIAVVAMVNIIKVWNGVIMVAQLAMKTFNLILAANPIGLVITAVLALIAALVWFFTQTETGKEIWNGFITFVMETATAIAEWFTYVFTEWIPGLWESFTTFLSETWEGFKESFMNVLESIGDFFRSMINGYIGMWESFINYFISGINSIIRGINKLKIEIPRIGDKPGMTVGFNLPEVPKVSIPRLAEGGIVKAQPGGILANLGEGRFDEAVVPLRPDSKFGSTYNITVNAGMGTDGARLGEQIVSAIKRYERQSGPVFASA